MSGLKRAIDNLRTRYGNVSDVAADGFEEVESRLTSIESALRQPGRGFFGEATPPILADASEEKVDLDHVVRESMVHALEVLRDEWLPNLSANREQVNRFIADIRSGKWKP